MAASAVMDYILLKCEQLKNKALVKKMVDEHNVANPNDLIPLENEARIIKLLVDGTFDWTPSVPDLRGLSCQDQGDMAPGTLPNVDI